MMRDAMRTVVFVLMNCLLSVKSSLISDITFALYSHSIGLPGRDIVDSTIQSGIRLFARQCAGANQREIFRREKGDNMYGVKMALFTPHRRYTYGIYEAADELVNNLDFNPEAVTVIYVHGFMDDPKSISARTITDSYLERGGHNILIFDSSKYVGDLLYLPALRFVPQLGEALALFLTDLVYNGVNPKSIHIVGFSIGAHISGIAGRIFTLNSNLLLPRITALDPANPCFSRPSEFRINKGDAAYVDVIHTSQGTLGLVDRIGHADFYINGGNNVIQPGCQDLPMTCSHSRAWLLYSETVLNENAFAAMSCNNWFELNAGRCNESAVTPMGFGTSPAVRGLFLVLTSDQPPFVPNAI